MSIEEYTKEELGQEILIRDQEIEVKDKRIATLERQIAKLEQAIIGHRSEKNKKLDQTPPDQINIFGEEYRPGEEQKSKTQVKGHKREKRKANRRQALPEDLPRQITRLEPPVDTSDMELVEVVVHEKLKIIPAKLVVQRIERPKYVDAQGKMHIAPYEDPLPKCNIAPCLAAHIVTNKYQHHLPLYRQVKIFEQTGIKLARSTLSDMVMRVGRKLEIVHKVMLKKALQSNYLMADESSIPVLTKDKPGSTLKGCMLAMHAIEQGLIVFDYIQTKHKVNIVDTLQTFVGHLQVDGNVSYKALEVDNTVTLMNCWVHARRYFVKSQSFDSARSSVVLDLLSEVYHIEKIMTQRGYTEIQIKSYRKRYTKPILRKIYNYCKSHYFTGGYSDPFQDALSYTLKRWIALNRFLGNGAHKLDTNLLENKIRPLALGRKNYLFCGSHQSAKVAAIFYSLIATSLQNGHDPKKTIEQLINRIDSHPVNKRHELIPDNNFVLH